MARQSLELVRSCYACGSEETNLNCKGSSMWHLNHDMDSNVLCNRCYCRYIYSRTVGHREYNKEYFKTMIRFKDKRIPIGYNPRKGMCSKCGKDINTGEINVTHMHHWVYIIIFPWFGTEELCVKCHKQESK